MDVLSSSGGPFDGFTSFIGRSFSRRARKPQAWTPHAHVPAYAELAPARVVSECAVSHRTLALEVTGTVIDHYVELSRKLTETKRQIELQDRSPEENGHYRRSQVAEGERQAWERWLGVIESSIKNAEAEVLAVVRAWESTRRPSEETGAVERGVVHKGRLYLALPGEGEGTFRLSVVDLRSSLNLDGSMAVIDVVSPERLGGPAGRFPRD